MAVRNGRAPVSHTPAYSSKQVDLWVRIFFLLALAITAFFVQLFVNGRGAAGGSYTAYLIVAPLLVALIAGGETQPPRGVVDAESDWIVAVLIGGGGLIAMVLFSDRLPTLARLWRIDQFGPVVWIGACAIVIFSVRYVLRLWSAWLFAIYCAPSLPYLLSTAALGGTEDDAVLVAIALGSVAVYFSTRVARRPWRLLAAGFNFAWAIGVDRLLGLDSVLARVVIVAGAIPLVSNTVLHHSSYLAGIHRFAGVTTVFPHRHAWSYAALVVIALGLLWVSLPVPKLPAVPQASSDWTTRMGLRPTAEFDFISRYAGPGATLVRYRLASGDDERAVAVDVITSPNLARLRDYDDAIWYPSPMPLNYKSAYLPGPVTVSARDVHSNPDRAQRQDSADWYALTWLWHTQKGYQRVTVVVNQARPSADPPEPQALTWRNSLLEPLLWVARQQPYSRGVVSPSVLDIADTLSHQILVAGAPK